MAAKEHAKVKPFKLMHSQTMLEVPENLEKKWLVVPFPHGRRVVLATKEFETHIYTNRGVRMMSFQSHLPGGNKKDKEPAEETVLDCVLDKDAGVIYVFDMLSWKGTSVSDSAAEFRFTWLKSKIDDIPSLSEKSLYNPYTIKTLPVFSCTKENIQLSLQGEVKAHGLLFYLKEGCYSPGNSPQLLWLKPYMVPELFEIEVSEGYMEKKPTTYTDFTSFVAKTKEQKEKEAQIKEEAAERKLAKKQAEKEQKEVKKKQDGGTKKKDRPVRPIRRANQNAAGVQKVPTPGSGKGGQKVPPIGRGGGGSRGRNRGLKGGQDYRMSEVNSNPGGYYSGSSGGGYSDAQAKFGNITSGYQDMSSRMSKMSMSEQQPEFYGGYSQQNQNYLTDQYGGDIDRGDSYSSLLGDYNQGTGSLMASYNQGGASYHSQQDYPGQNQSQQRGSGSYSPGPGSYTASHSQQTLPTSNYQTGPGSYTPNPTQQSLPASSRQTGPGSYTTGLSQPSRSAGNQSYQQNQTAHYNDNKRRQTVADRLRSGKSSQNKDAQKQLNKDMKEFQKKSKRESQSSNAQPRLQLMCSQWLTQVPQDFDTEWLLLLSPVGQHRRVVAQDGITTAYNKKGREVEQFKSCLPGGHEHFKHCEENHTVLDCIFSNVNKTYYIIDIMCWKGQPLCGCETGFRFHWLQLQMKENRKLEEESKLNKYPFVALENVPCNKASMENFLAKDHGFEVNGMLFYHKTCKYVTGSVPDVLWLKPYMLPEVLGIQIPDIFMNSKPDSYVNFITHLKKFQESEEKLESGDVGNEADQVDGLVEAASS